MPNIDERNMFYGAAPNTFEKAAELRKNMTEAEKILWEALKDRKTFKTKFRRQHPIDIFIVDFYSHEYKLIIEVDGSIHSLDDIKERDGGREYELKKFGLKIIRFSNEEVIGDIEDVKRRILDEMNRLD